MKAIVRAVLLIFSIIQLNFAGCAVMLPVEGKPEINLQDNSEDSGNTLVTVGPRRLLNILAQQISASEPKLQSVDPLLFRDTAFPQGGWELAYLLEPEQRFKLVQSLQVDYMVLISPLVYKVGDESGFFFPLVAGLQKAEHKSSLSATIYDLTTGSILSRIDVTSKGNERVLYYVLVFTGTEPHVVTPTIETIGKEIARTIGYANQKTRVRYAVLAAEQAQRENNK